ncbi:hypothetical protein Q5O24_02215 [Eubacteriaceae bacterium ES3]|nr:hypothetical protein Q5O24_02215 [Eubacteriaceae bacterium ES3]
MNAFYGYREKIDELNILLTKGVLMRSHMIQIRRSNQSVYEGYYPIVDWSFSDEVMQEMLKLTVKDNEKTIARKMKISADYENDKVFFQPITVSECLRELETWNLE